MKHFWLNNGEPDEQGKYVAEVQDDNGRMVSTYKGNSVREVADQLLASNASASAEINRLRGTRQPDRAPATPPIGVPRNLTVDERFRLSQEIADPDKGESAMDELITARVGASPAAIGATLAAVRNKEHEEYTTNESRLFVRNNPDYYATDVNMRRMSEAIALKKLDWTSNNLQIVYDELQLAGLLIERPAEEPAEPQHETQQSQESRQAANPASEPNPPVQSRPRHTSMATGIRSSDTSGSKPPVSRTQKFTPADIQKMPRAEYLERMREPAFRNEVDRMGRR